MQPVSPTMLQTFSPLSKYFPGSQPPTPEVEFVRETQPDPELVTKTRTGKQTRTHSNPNMFGIPNSNHPTPKDNEKEKQ